MTHRLGIAPAMMGSLALLTAACGGGGGGGGGGGPVVTVNPQASSLAALPPNSQLTMISTGGLYDAIAGTLSSVQSPVDGGGTATDLGDRVVINVPARGLSVSIADNHSAGTFGDLSLWQGPDYSALFVTLDQMVYGITIRDVNPSLNLYDVSAFAGGIRTPADQIPSAGSAVYSGGVVGMTGNPTTDALFAGRADLNVNFGARSVSGTFSSMQSVDIYNQTVRPFNSMALSGNWAPGSNVYSGTVTTTTNPGGPSALPVGSSGPMVGSFFGAGANAARETGGTFLINTANGIAAGAFGARR